MDTAILFAVGVFLCVIVVWLIGYTFEMNQVNDVSQEYWDEYWGRGDEGESEEIYGTSAETGHDDSKQVD